MDSSIISALAALAGAITGGLTSVLASWLTQHAQARAQWRAQDKLRRQELYKEFIEAASKCYINALQYDKADIPALVELYPGWAGCVSCPRQRWSRTPSSSREGSSIPIWSLIRIFWNCGRWRTAAQSIFSAISARPAAPNSSRCADNSELRTG